ncbi:ABC transporter permease [Nocardiopsis changdeensis]|uniref:ABC transporter permease n=1 Tax=Nocardiopsis changdeensis TaxID=2831969 RepID=A0ABX8BIW9_9ACTN|nr:MULTISPECIES: ABC transporter permease [Nocardiopsis]QUX22014.1 ABC transporter permease [Nocardiopsis changdeensis]QYX37952.1 ABC transporter permease [Nocardiopsis sp. MT53]
MIHTLTELLAMSVALGLPIMVAAAAEAVSERAGVLNMSVEGMMVTGCLAGVLAAVATGSPWAGLAAGAAAGVLVGVLQGLLSVAWRADQIVTGLALNTLALSGTVFAARLLLDRDTVTPGFDRAALPLLSDLPVLGRALFSLPAPGYLLIGAVVALTLLTSRRTAWGLAVDATGEDAVKADRAGLPVARIRHLAVLLVGGAGGLAGAYIALAQVKTFTDHMTAGVGYLAVVAVIAARWRTGRVAAVALVFGAAQALRFTLPALGVALPAALLVALPYLLALAAVAGLVSGSRRPSDLTVPFVRAGRTG